MASKSRKFPPGFLKGYPGIARNKHQANFLPAKRCYIRLHLPAPMNLHPVGPGLQAIVETVGEPDFLLRVRFQTSPTPHSGANPICTDDPLRGHHLTTKNYAVSGEPRYGRVPQEGNSTLLRSLDHLLMEDCSAQANPGNRWKSRFGDPKSTR